MSLELQNIIDSFLDSWGCVESSWPTHWNSRMSLRACVAEQVLVTTRRFKFTLTLQIASHWDCESSSS